MRILLVEDDLMLGEAMQYALRQHKLAADWLKLGKEAINACKSEIFDLLILDLGLADIDGLDVLKTIRKSGNSVPILILTAKDAVENKICGSKREARDFFAQGSITCNGEKISDENTPVTKAMAIEEKVIVVRRGKKKNYILKF